MPTNAPAHLPWDFRSANPDEIRSKVASRLKPFVLHQGRNRTYDARLFHRSLRHTALSVIDYGGEVEIHAGQLEKFYILQFALKGSYESCLSRRSIVVDQTRAQLIHPALDINMNWSTDCRMLAIRIEPEIYRRCFKDLVGVLPGREPTDGAIDLATIEGQSLRRIVDYIREEVTKGGLLQSVPAAVMAAERILITNLILAMHADGSLPAQGVALPNYVRRAMNFIEHNLCSHLDSDDIVAASGVGARTLYAGFRRFCGIGPVAWHRNRRLEQARRDLLASRSGTSTVTDIALKWGFTHFGRFSGYYCSAFGETPTDTLRRPPADDPLSF
jgi:AraC-like DNA-binding protein